MELDKLNHFLKHCCRVCLSIENDMVDSSNIVEDFNKTIDQMLFECVNMKMTNDSSYPQKLCEVCTTELVMVAKFREKCGMSAAALDQLKQQVNKDTKEGNENEKCLVEMKECEEEEEQSNSNSDAFYENIEYVEENVEYVIYDTNTDYLDVTDVHAINTLQALTKSTENIIGNEEECVTEINTNEIKRKVPSKIQIEQSRNNEIENKTTMKMSIMKHRCKFCGAAFAQLNNFTRHLQTHNENDIELNFSEVDKIEDSITVSPYDHQNIKSRKNIQKNHLCKYCSRAFPSLSLLATHTRIHTGERPFQCSICKKSFKTQGAVDLHVRRHSTVKPYKCDICQRGFVESSNLKVHMRTHTGERPHQCTVCSRSFSRVFLLQIHQRTHTGEKPFSCEICQKSFAQQGDLSAHKRIHSGERPHRCQICHKGFIKSSGLTQHMRRHFRSTRKTNSDGIDNVENSSIKDNRSLINEKTMVVYKEYNENSTLFDDYLGNC